MEIGVEIDKLFLLKAKIKQQKIKIDNLKAAKDLAKLVADAAELENKIIINLDTATGTTGVMGKKAKGVLKIKTVPNVSDWDLFYKHVAKKKDFSFLQKRLSSTAFNEHWEAGEKIPGVKKVHLKSLSLTKI